MVAGSHKAKFFSSRLNKNLLTAFNKGIFSDFRKIFSWLESEDTNQKSLFPKFKLMPISRFQLMHDYVCFIAPIDYWVE